MASLSLRLLASTCSQRVPRCTFIPRPLSVILRSRYLSQRRAMSLSAVSTPNAPAAVGPYSQAIKAGNLVFLSGCIPINPTSAKVVEGGVEEQARQALTNLKAVVQASGTSIDKVAKTTVFLQSMDDFAKINAIYSDFFGSHKPARSCIEVAKLPLGVLFEIEAVAILE